MLTGPSSPDLIAGIDIAFDGVDQPVELDEFEKLLVAHGQVAIHAQAQDFAAVEHGLGQCHVVAQQQLVGRGRGKGGKLVIFRQVGVQPCEHIFAADLVFESDLLQQIFAFDWIDEAGLADDRMVGAGQRKNGVAQFLRRLGTGDVEFAVVVAE